MMKEKNIRELAKRMGLISVENMCKYTITQLVVMIANKVNELIDEVWQFETDIQEILKTQNENIQYLLGEGLHLEVANVFDKWVNDGTFDTLINQSALKKVNDRIDETNTRLSSMELELKNLGYINVKDHGVRGDGVTDDTDAIQSLIDNTSNYIWMGENESTYKKVKPIKIYFPKGKYVITRTINLSPYITIDGEFTSLGNNYKINETGKGLVDFKENGTCFVCKFNTTSKTFAFNLSAYHSDGVRDTNITRNYNAPSSQLCERLEGVSINNITIKAENYLFGGLYMVGSPFTTLKNVCVLGADIGAYIRGSWNIRILNCGFHTKNYGVFCYRDVNNISIDGCSIEHYYMYQGNGLGDRTYDTKTLPLLYPSEGEHMPSTYVSLTTGVYCMSAWQISLSNTTIQNFQRAIYSYQANMMCSTLWIESIKTVDVHVTHSTMNLMSCRKETNTSKFIRATGSANVFIQSLSGANNRGSFIPDMSKLIDYKDSGADVILVGCPSSSPTGTSPLNVEGVKFNGGNTINQVVKVTITPSSTENLTVDFPTGFDKYNCVVSSIKRYRSNSVVVVESSLNVNMNNTGITFTPQEAVKHEIILMKIS